ncbi:MAG: WYL domain-containing protein [Bacteroidaceae bacterium]|nr:WYL domain-containing protein [Bacteroidaceae bacterium]
MNIEKIKRVVWLASMLKDQGPLTLKEINRKWELSSFNSAGEGPMTQRSFLRVRCAAEELFDIDIECERSTNRYYISGSSLQDRQWIIDSFALKSMLDSHNSLSHRIILEEVPSGYHHLAPIMDAMKSNRVILMRHQKFGSDTPSELLVEPFCLRVSCNRWYMVGRSHDDGKKIRTYALDRMTLVELTDDTFRLPASFNARRYFKYAYGPFVRDKSEADRVVIRATPLAANYLRTLPLHTSQRELKQTADGTDFQYHIVPTPDFRQALLRWGSELKVLAPESLREEMKHETMKMMKYYE